MYHYEYELGKAAEVITRELFKLKDGETFVITADTESDIRVVNATARSAFAAGAKPMVIWLASPLGVGQAADPMLPLESLTGALKGADAWVEFNNQWLLYSTPWERATKENRKLRYLNLVGMNTDMMIRNIARVDHSTLKIFLHQAAEVITAAKSIHIESPSGTDLKFENVSGRDPQVRDGYADKPGTFMMAGFIAWSPNLESINGTLVFDGSLIPPCGKLEEPIRLTIEAGEITTIEGGVQARQFEAWIDSFDHPQMRRLAHGSFGFGPGAKLTGNIVEDERVWGCSEWGIGHIGPHLIPPDGVPAPTHADGQSLNCSVWLDDKQFMDKGQLLDPDLKKIAKKLGKP